MVRFLTEAMTGKRPTNSGISPYLMRSKARCGQNRFRHASLHAYIAAILDSIIWQIYLPVGSTSFKILGALSPLFWLSSLLLIGASNPID